MTIYAVRHVAMQGAETYSIISVTWQCMWAEQVLFHCTRVNDGGRL